MVHVYHPLPPLRKLLQMCSQLFVEWPYNTPIFFEKDEFPLIHASTIYPPDLPVASISMFIPISFNMVTCITVLLHELGHIQIDKGKYECKKHLSEKVQERLAWKVAKRLAKQYNLPYDDVIETLSSNSYQYRMIPWSEIQSLTDSVRNKSCRRNLRKFAKRYHNKKQRRQPIIIGGD